MLACSVTLGQRLFMAFSGAELYDMQGYRAHRRRGDEANILFLLQPFDYSLNRFNIVALSELFTVTFETIFLLSETLDILHV